MSEANEKNDISDRELGVHGEQLKTLFKGQERLESGQANILGKTDGLSRQITALTVQIAALSAKVTCPSPGACLELSAKLEATQKRVETLETWRNIVVGGSIVTWIVILGGTYVAYDWFKTHLTTIIAAVQHWLKG